MRAQFLFLIVCLMQSLIFPWQTNAAAFLTPRLTAPEPHIPTTYSSTSSVSTSRCSRLYQATSSSELKKKKNQSPGRRTSSSVPPPSSTGKRTRSTINRKGSTSSVSSKSRIGKATKTKPVSTSSSTAPSVVTRLSQAAKRANAKKKKREQEAKGEQEKDESEAPPKVPLASLQQLTHAIDERLRASQNSPEQRNRDSMTSVVRHNQDKRIQSASPRHYTYTESNHQDMSSMKPDREVAIVLAKPLQHDCLTLEYANRIRRLVRAMLDTRHGDDNDGSDHPYRPDVICFVGPQSSGNILVDADTGYLYFQFLCQAHGVDIAGIDIHLVKGSVAEGALQQIAFFLQETCLPAWLRASQQQAKEREAEERDATQGDEQSSSSLSSVQRRRNRLLRVHFSLISSEYELCQLNDIHLRSPGQSVLRALESWSQRSFSTTWSYMYVTTVTTSADPTEAFLSKTYKTAQQLLPVIQNLRNVVRNREFFQTESYRVLVAARRSLVSDMESLYERQPQLKAVHNWRSSERSMVANGGSSDLQSRPVDVVLEGALLLLGRCVDIVRPAGLLTGAPVSQDDWKLALVVLKQAFEAITTVCDPDRPLEPDEWMDLGDEADHIDAILAQSQPDTDATP